MRTLHESSDVLDYEDGGHMFLSDVELSPNYTASQSRGPYSS
jgi:hypothetical protein